MWTCPTCGEEIEDQFDTCWKCTKPGSTTEGPRDRSNEGFLDLWFRYWRRGWLILVLVFCIGLLDRIVVYLLKEASRSDNRLYPFLILCLGVLVVPAGAYWLFVLFFGEAAWPWSRARPEISAERRAFSLLSEATKAESRGEVQVALARYQEVVDKFAGTPAGRDAQVSLESLRTKLR